MLDSLESNLNDKKALEQYQHSTRDNVWRHHVRDFKQRYKQTSVDCVADGISIENPKNIGIKYIYMGVDFIDS